MNSTTSEAILKLKGKEIYLKQWHPENPLTQTPLILLHDSLGSVDLWRDFPQKLCEHLQIPVYAYDRWGFGRSSARQELPSAEFIAEEAQTHLPEILQALKISQFYLLGHSVGGAMALTAAAANPNCLAVISESAQAFVEDRTREGIEAARISFKNSEQLARLAKYHGDKTPWVLNAWTEVWLSSAFAEWSLSPVLGHIRCPTLVIHGDQDEFGSVRFPQKIAAGIPHAQMIVLENTGHVPHKQNVAVVLSLIGDFLRPKHP